MHRNSIKKEFLCISTDEMTGIQAMETITRYALWCVYQIFVNLIVSNAKKAPEISLGSLENASFVNYRLKLFYDCSNTTRSNCSTTFTLAREWNLGVNQHIL